MSHDPLAVHPLQGPGIRRGSKRWQSYFSSQVLQRVQSLVSRRRCGREIARLRCEIPSILRLTPKIARGSGPALGQTGRFLYNSTVKLSFCFVCPWDGSSHCLSLRELSRKGSLKNVYVFCVSCFFALNFPG